MRIGTLELELFLPEAHSLKDKRRVVKSIKDRVQGRFNVAIAEVDALDSWQRAVLGVATVGNDGRLLESVLSKVVNHVQAFRPGVILNYHIEIQ
jgi:uncharacterized protein YlxP (DUF503 family)